MIIGAFQFSGSSSIEANLKALGRGIEEARNRVVDLLVSQECALCGYPPVELESIAKLDFDELEEAEEGISILARKAQIIIALGTIERQESKYFNTTKVFDASGNLICKYQKRALWGWDRDNFAVGNETGEFAVNHWKIGCRICYESRFPEYFRELFRNEAKLGIVGFCDTSDEEDEERYDIIQSSLVSRAAENVMYVAAANSISNHQTAPTCIINPDGRVLAIAPKTDECLVSAEIESIEMNRSREGRIKIAGSFDR